MYKIKKQEKYVRISFIFKPPSKFGYSRHCYHRLFNNYNFVHRVKLIK